MPQANSAYIQAQTTAPKIPQHQQQTSIQNQYQNPWMSNTTSVMETPHHHQNHSTITFSPTRNEETANPAIFRHLVDDLRSTLPKTRGLTKSHTVTGVNNTNTAKSNLTPSFNPLINHGDNLVNETSTNNAFSHHAQEPQVKHQPTRFNSTASSGNPFA